MSLSTLTAEPRPRPGETFSFQGVTTDLELRIPATIQGPKRTEYAKGRVWVSDHRVAFIADRSTSTTSSGSTSTTSTPVSSLEIPYIVLLSTEFNLPIFSANHIILSFLPDPNSSSPGADLVTESDMTPTQTPAPTLPNPGRGSSLIAKLVVGEGAAHAVWKRIEGERARCEEMRRTGEEEDLPVYQA